MVEDQAGLGGDRVDPPSAGLAGQGAVVLVGQVAAQEHGKLEASPCRSACRGRPPMLHPAWLNAGITSVAKAHRRGLSIPSTLTVVVASTLPPRATIVAVAVAAGDDLPLARDGRDLGVEAGPFDRAGQVAGRAVGVGRRRDELPGGAAADQRGVCARARPRPSSGDPIECAPVVLGRARSVSRASTSKKAETAQARRAPAVRRAFIGRSSSSKFVDFSGSVGLDPAGRDKRPGPAGAGCRRRAFSRDRLLTILLQSTVHSAGFFKQSQTFFARNDPERHIAAPRRPGRHFGFTRLSCFFFLPYLRALRTIGHSGTIGTSSQLWPCSKRANR